MPQHHQPDPNHIIHVPTPSTRSQSHNPPSNTINRILITQLLSALSQQHASTNISHPPLSEQPSFVTASMTTAKRWQHRSLTSNSSDNSESTLTYVFAPSYRHITDLTKTSGIPFFLIANSSTILDTLWKLSLGPQNTYATFLQRDTLFAAFSI